MKHLKSFATYIKESISVETAATVVIKTGEKLFHATGEPFNATDLRGGGYDSVIWTAQESGIAQAYIPVSGTTTYISSSTFTKPSQDVDTQKYQRQIGIEFDYTRIKFEHNHIIGGYPIPNVFLAISHKSQEAREAWHDALNKLKVIENELYSGRNIAPDRKIELAEQYWKLKHEADTLRDAYNAVNEETLRNQYVNAKLEELGYKPNRDGYNDDHSWRIKTTTRPEPQMLPADYRKKGRLLILTAREDIRFFDYAGEREADLTDVDYHNIPMFRAAEKGGFDGIRITDFAQVESEGNLGHISFGIFNSSIYKFDIEVLENVEHPTEEEIQRMYKTRNWHSREYLNKKGKL
jgi:hypothetical protein